jgi:mRNA interferase MazF
MVDFNQGDIVVMDFDPQSGHEQRGRRPAIVLSNDVLNHHSDLALVCPITNTIKNHPFHIKLDDRTNTTGVILCDQAKMLDVHARNIQFKEKCPEDLWTEAKQLIISFL